MSFFKISKIDLKKHYIITSSASACGGSLSIFGGVGIIYIRKGLKEPPSAYEK